MKATKEEGIERLRMLYAMMAGIPGPRVDLNNWRGSINTPDKKMRTHACGTTACMAGWAAIYPPFNKMGLSAGSYGEPRLLDVGYTWNALSSFFGLSLFEAEKMFDTSGAAGGYTPQIEGDTLRLTEKQQALSRVRLHLLRAGAITPERSAELRVHEHAGTFEPSNSQP